MNHKESTKLLELECQILELEEELDFISKRQASDPNLSDLVEFHEKQKILSSLNCAYVSELIKHSREYRQQIKLSLGI